MREINNRDAKTRETCTNKIDTAKLAINAGMLKIAAKAWGDDNKAILGIISPTDLGRDILESGNCYRWYGSLAKIIMPTSICEIGVRYGYSLVSMISGAIQSGMLVENLSVMAVDNESYVPGCLKRLSDYLESQLWIKPVTYQIKPKHTNGFDLISVDGDHTFHGALQDLAWAWVHCHAGGYIIIDDMDHPAVPGVRKAVELVCKITRAQWFEVPSYRGTAVIWRGYEGI